MANTYVDYTATAGQTDFAFNFPYLEDEHVKVYINSIEKLPSDFTITTTPATAVVLNIAASGGEKVRVRRKSQPNDNLVDFVNGSVLTESELDRAYRHTRYLAEEASEFASVSLELEGLLEGSQIKDGTVSTTKITDGAVIASKIATNAVDGTKIATNAVDGTKIADGAVTNTKIATNAVDGTKIADGVVINSKIGADAVDGTKIADDSIDSEHYVDGSIDNAHIADGVITSGKISTTDSVFNIQSDGRVGIGTTNPGDILDLTAASNPTIFFNESTNSYQARIGIPSATGQIFISNASVGALAMRNDSGIQLGTDIPVLTINSSTYVGIGNASPAYALDVVGDINASGEVRNSGVILTSDDRVKHNEEVITNALSALAQLTPKKYIKTTEMYEADHNFELDTEGKPVDEEVEYKVEAGVIAQDVLQVEELAFAVTPETTNESGEVVGPHGVNYNSLFTYAVAAIKEQQAIIEDLKARVEALEA
jgi:hypothetical protein